MGRYFLFSGCVFAAFFLAGLTSAELLAPLLDFLAAKRTALMASGLFGVIAMLCASLLFRGIGFFNVLYVMAKAVYKLAQLFLCAMSLAALLFWFNLGVNLWLGGGGTLTIVLLGWLYGAALCLRLFDFNYPVREVLFSYSFLPFACLALIWIGDFIR